MAGLLKRKPPARRVEDDEDDDVATPPQRTRAPRPSADEREGPTYEGTPPEPAEAPNVRDTGNPGEITVDAFVENGIRLIFSEQSVPEVLNAIEVASNPAMGLGNALAVVLGRLQESAGQASAVISENVMRQGAVKLAKQIAFLSEESGGHKFSGKEMTFGVGWAFKMLKSGGGVEEPGPEGPPNGLMG